jgi:eukaryotic translation initiation factor 2C
MDRMIQRAIKAFGMSTNFKPESLIMYRDGVSEGQFEEVARQELLAIKSACKALGVNPKITFIIVGKRHHTRFFPMSQGERDKSGNCPAGTVIDTEITHPWMFDFYLQSHGGLLGTSRPSHYSVLYDDNNFSPDALQSLSFTLCHVYARATRSVSIPAPVYYADIACERFVNHFPPNFLESDVGSTTSGEGPSLEEFKAQFQRPHNRMKDKMYYM